MDSWREQPWGKDPVPNHVFRLNQIRELFEQKLTAIALAAEALEAGGNVEEAARLIKDAVAEAREGLRLIRL